MSLKNWIAVNLVTIDADNHGEAWAQIRGSMEVSLHNRIGALLEPFSLVNLLSGESAKLSKPGDSGHAAVSLL
jgi:hypothetical protein